MYQIEYKNQKQPILFHFYRQKEHICVTLSNNYKIRKKELNSRLILFVVPIAKIFITLYYFWGIPNPHIRVAHDLYL